MKNALVAALMATMLFAGHPSIATANEGVIPGSDDPFSALLPRLTTVPRTIDSNGDGELSTGEILNSATTLKTLDANGDGMIDRTELGAYPPQLPLARWHAVTNVIDLDGDLRLSADEIESAPQSLTILDKNHDWHIDRVEGSLRGRPDGPLIGTLGSSLDRWLHFREYTTEVAGPIMPGQDPREFTGFTLIHDASDFGEVQKVASTYLLDPKGRKVHEWQSSGEHPEATVAYLLPNGNLLRTYSENNWLEDKRFPVGAASSIEILDWDGKVLWNFTMSEPTKYSFHHDVEYMPNGNILAIRYTGFTLEEMVAMGWDPDNGDKARNAIDKDGTGLLWMDTIVELKPNLTDGGTEIVWEWNSWEHLVQDQFPDRLNFGDTSNPSRIHVNYIDLDVDIPFNAGQLFHVNTVDYNPELDLIMLSSPTYGEAWIIDHSTSREEAASDTGGTYGKGGQLLYRWGNKEAYGAGERNDTYLYWQHDTQWIANGLPGAGNLLVYNNGTRRRLDDTYMREAEGGIMSDSYSNMIEVKLPFNKDTGFDQDQDGEIVWSWEAKNRADYFSPFMSGVERLPNGNTIFGRGYDKWIIEVTPEGDRVLDYTPEGWGRLHRVYKYAPDFPGLKFGECAAAPSGCPEVNSIQPWDDDQ